MRKLGLIGGISWISTEIYYRTLNLGYGKAKGGMHSAPLLIESLDFAGVGRTCEPTDWTCTAATLCESAKRLQDAGAGALLICANSMHKVYDEVAAAVAIPIIHIADEVGKAMAADEVETAALIGTRNVMSEPWYRQRLVKHGVSLLPADMREVDTIDRIIYNEVMLGMATRDSERVMKSILTDMDKDGADAVVLGCTELSLIVNTRANVLPIYDSTDLHAKAGLAWLLNE
jgi:aspartate racemase